MTRLLSEAGKPSPAWFAPTMHRFSDVSPEWTAEEQTTSSSTLPSFQLVDFVISVYPAGLMLASSRRDLRKAGRYRLFFHHVSQNLLHRGQAVSRDDLLLSNALIEAVFNLPHSTTGGGEIALNVLDIFEPVSQLARAVRVGSHAELYSYRRRRRVDWFVNVSSTVSSGRDPQHWTEPEFPGREPRGHTGQRPFTPASGLVPRKIRGLSPSASPDRLERVVVEGFLEDNGYDGTDCAVGDAFEALDARASA